MAVAQRIAGVAFIDLDGIKLAIHGNFTVGQSKYDRSMIFGQEGLAHGYVENFRAPFIEGDLTLPQSQLPDSFSLEQLEMQTDVTIMAQLADGLQYVLSGAICKASLDARSPEGRVTVRWEGMRCFEILPKQDPWPEEVVKDNGEEPPVEPEPDLFTLGISILGGPDVLG